MNCKRIAALFMAAVFCLGLCGCEGGGADTDLSEGQAAQDLPLVSQVANSLTELDTDTGYDAATAVRITLADGASTSTAPGSVSVGEDEVTILREGTYVVSGSLSAGKLVVDAAEQAVVRLVLDGVNITSADGAALHIKKTGQVAVTLAQGSENTLTANSLLSNVDGALYTKAPLSLNGAGALTVTSPVHGIVCKDRLTVTGGQVTVTAEEHTIQCKGDALFTGGTFTLTAGRDGIHVENTEDTSRGSLSVSDGTFVITAEEDGMSASTRLQITGGTGAVTTGGGAANATASHGNDGFGPGGWWGQYEQNTTTDEVSAKGCKAEGDLLFAGGSWTLDTVDDGLHSNSDLTVSGGEITIASGDDGIHADGVTVLQNGTVTVTESYEGIEGNAIEVAGGTIRVTSSDDGLNAAGGNDQSGYGDYRQDGFAESGGNSYIRISGGTLTVDAGGDGIDANQALYVNGGETYVAGPTNSGNGALDYGSRAEITGGLFVATGASGMAQGFSSAEGQGALLVNTAGSGGEITLTDESGTVLFNWTPGKNFNSVVLSCPGMEQNGTYTLTVGDSSQRITLDDWLYGAAGGMMGGPGGPGGMGGPGGGGRPGGRW